MLDFFGKSINILAIYLNISEWLLSANFNKTLVLIISLMAIVYWAMKIYDQYIVTRKFKRDSKKDGYSKEDI
jgi:hypothetical protein